VDAFNIQHTSDKKVGTGLGHGFAQPRFAGIRFFWFRMANASPVAEQKCHPFELTDVLNRRPE
jgi:hypothetical protein